MHRAVMGALSPSLHIDHKDHNGLNNQKSNLRECTRSQNITNALKRKKCSSKYKGVCYFKANKKWGAYATLNGKHTFLGLFKEEIDAAKKYDEVIVKYFGEFANLNFKENEQD